MEVSNETIANRIKEARIERGFKQKDVAERLNRTIGAVSQLEQGNVQISVVDLHKLANMFNKPIEFFFGEEYIGDDAQALISMIRKLSPDERNEQVAVIMMILQMQNIAETLEETDDKGIQEDLAREFYKVFVPFSITVNHMTEQINDIKDKLEEVLKIEKLDVGKG